MPRSSSNTGETSLWLGPGARGLEQGLGLGVRFPSRLWPIWLMFVPVLLHHQLLWGFVWVRDSNWTRTGGKYLLYFHQSLKAWWKWTELVPRPLMNWNSVPQPQRVRRTRSFIVHFNTTTTKLTTNGTWVGVWHRTIRFGHLRRFTSNYVAAHQYIMHSIRATTDKWTNGQTDAPTPNCHPGKPGSEVHLLLNNQDPLWDF